MSRHESGAGFEQQFGTSLIPGSWRADAVTLIPTEADALIREVPLELAVEGAEAPEPR